jgi:streptogramin lyase
VWVLAALGAAGAAHADTLTRIDVGESGQLEQITFDASGAAWISGTLNSTVYLYRVRDNGVVNRFTMGGGEAQGLALGGDGRLYVCLTRTKRIARFDPGQPVGPSNPTLISLPATPGNGCWDIAAGPPGDQHVYFTGWDSNWVGSVSTVDGSVRTTTVPGQPRGLAVTSSGIWVTLWQSDQVARVDLDAGSYLSYPLAGDPAPLAQNLEPRDIAVDPGGKLWATHAAGLQRVDPLNAVQTPFPVNPTARPWQVDADAAGNLWFSANGGLVGRLTPGGAEAYYQLPANRARGIGVRSDGTVWAVLETGNAVNVLPTDIRPTVANVRAAATGEASAAVTAAVDSRGVATQYRVEYSRDASFSRTTSYESVGSVDGPQDRRIDVPGLEPGTWNFRVRAVNAFGERISDEASVTVVGPPAPPPAVDLDGDGSPQPADCDDRRSDVRPGAQEVLDNTTDENCDGTAEFHPPIPTKLGHAWRPTKRFTQPAVLVLRRLPANATATLECEGRGCTFSRKRVRFVRARGEASILKYLRRDPRKKASLPKLRVGATIQVTITAPDVLGKIYTFRIRRGKNPSLRTGCTAAGVVNRIACPAGAGS